LQVQFTPDERQVQSSSGFSGTTQVFHLNSQAAGIGYQSMIGIYALMVVSVDCTNQELSFPPYHYVTMFSLSAGIRLKF
jgi:hypothetical protein